MWGEPFHINVDASNFSIGIVLGQKDVDGPIHVIYNISKNLIPEERNYTTTKEEFLTIVYAINEFRHYITRYKNFVHIDHAAIRYLMNKSIIGG